MKSKDIEILIEKYLNGETTPEEEKALALEVSRDDAPQEWKIIAEMLGELTVDEALYDKMMAERNKKPRIVKLWPWVAAACVAALIIVFLVPPRALQPPKGELQIAHVAEDSIKQKEEVTGKEEPQQFIANAKHEAPKKRKATIHHVAKVETVEKEPLLAEVTSESSHATEDIFDATLANVRRAALQKMMSCDMQCMNEDINLRATHLSTLIQEQNQ